MVRRASVAARPRRDGHHDTLVYTIHISSTPIRIGIIGTGFGALVQLPGLLAMDEAQVIGIASKDADKANALSAVHNLPRTFATWQELVACDEIDLISVTTPPFMHQEIVSAAIKAGKHVLCEKPFTMNAVGAKKLLSEANAAGIVHAIDFEFRDLHVMQTLKNELEKSGNDWIEHATLSWRVGTWADATRPWRWQCDKEQGGGVLGALGVHLFDATQWLLGPVHQEKADVQIKITERPDGAGGMRDVTAEDYASVDMTSAAGFPVNVTVTNVEATGNGLSIIVEGKDRSLRLLSAEQDYGRGLRLESVMPDGITILAKEDEPPAGTDARIPPFQRFATRLLKAVQEQDTSFRPSFEDGLNAQILRDGALESLDIADRAS